MSQQQDALLGDIKSLIEQARSAAARSINTLQVRVNFEIGRRIVEEEQRGENRAQYGRQLLVALADGLTNAYGRGFSRSNLEYMRKFFLTYREKHSSISQKPSGKLADPEISQKPSAQSVSSIPESALTSPGNAFSLSWSHYVFLIAIKNAEERQFYEIESAQNDWSLPELRRQFDSGLYERLALSRDKAAVLALSQQGQLVAKPADVIKNPYVLIDLKLGKLTHQNLGQMQMYVNYFDRFVKQDSENRTVGIILCKEKSDALVEITLPPDANIHASEYQLYLPSKAELQQQLNECLVESAAVQSKPAPTRKSGQ